MARGRGSQISWRKVRASWRDTLLLLREFGWPLFLFILTLVGAGILYYLLAAGARQISADDVLAILAGPEQIGLLIEDN